jgi:hypothetical protein
MLYWGIFTSGFIVGGLLSAALLDRKNIIKDDKSLTKVSITPKIWGNDPDNIFAQITQINYSKNR